MRFDKITKFAGIASCAAALPISAVAQQWQLIDDFESYETQASYQTGGELELPYPGASNGGRGFMDIWGTADGIEGVGGEKAAHFWHGITDANAGDFWHQIPLPSEIPDGQSGTVYLRLWQNGTDLNWHVTLSKIAAGQEPQSTPLWGNQSAIVRFNQADPLVVQVHSGTYISSDLSPQLNEWYEYWIVAHNTGESGNFEVWVREPGQAEAHQLEFIVSETETTTTPQFRNKTVGSLKTLVLARNNEFGTDDVYLVDDIYMALGDHAGIDPREPVEECDNPWADWCDEDGDGWIDTGDGFLSWIYFDNTGWIFIQDLNQWVYLPAENVTASGAWTYLPRL